MIVSSMILAAVALQLPGASAGSQNEVAASMTVGEVATMLREDWGLPCMVEGFEAMAFDGEKFFETLQPKHITPQVKAKFFPNCIDTHWQFLWDRLGVSSSTIVVGGGGRSRTGPERRGLSTPDTFSGVEIKKNNSAVMFGTVGDAALTRTDERTLTISDTLNVVEALYVNGENVLRKRCGDVDTTGYNGTVTVGAAPTDGDFIPKANIECPTGNLFPKTRVRWVCDEEGGVAYPSTDLCFYSFVHCHEDILGGGWDLVRRVKPGTTWHPATDSLFGTDEYGTWQNNGTVDATFTRVYADEITDETQFLFTSGDCVHWLVADMETVLETFGSNFDAEIISASDDPNPHTAKWYNRVGTTEDPWISLEDHGDAISAGTIIYGEDGYSGSHYGMLQSNNGANVFIRIPSSS